MHTKAVNSGIRIHYNSDYSGDVIITVKPDMLFCHNATIRDLVDSTYFEVTLPFSVIKELVAEYVRDNLNTWVEGASADQLLNLRGFIEQHP